VIATTEPLVRAEGVWKVYRRGSRDVVAVAGVDLAIAPGEVTFVLGPSGSGKSTLLHLLGALDRPSEGRVFSGGRDLSTLGDDELSRFRRRQVGFVFQSFHLLPTLGALANVLLPLVPEGVTDGDRARAEALLVRMGLGERLGHRPSELSGGEQQRVAIARALVADPPLILADEPTGELDSKTGAEIVALLRAAVAERGKTFVIVTHEASLVEAGDRVVRIKDGRIIDDGRSQAAP
jgi:ABC-type lipoprotein export system ATPase subunit